MSASENAAATVICSLPSTSITASPTRELLPCAVIASHLPEGESCIALTLALRKKVEALGSAPASCADTAPLATDAAASIEHHASRGRDPQRGNFMQIPA